MCFHVDIETSGLLHPEIKQLLHVLVTDVLCITRRLIYQSDLTAVGFDLLYNAGHVVDGMSLDDTSKYLYWTTYDMGSVARLDLVSHTRDILVTDLDKPRAIVVDNKNRCETTFYIYKYLFSLIVAS